MKAAIRTVAIAVIALSVAAVVLHWSTRPDPTILSATITRQAPELGPNAHLLLPGLRDAVMVVPDRPHDPFEVVADDRFSRIQRLRTFTVTTNALGLRSPEVGAKQGRRILCVGDSVTFGWGVSDDETYPALLGRRLGVDVINAGVPAMKPGSVAAWVQQNAAALQPDLVLFARRPDHAMPDPWRDYQQAVRAVVDAVHPAKVGVILPPISTFDPMGVAAMDEENRRVAQLVSPLPVLDLTPAFRAALPQPGVIMEIEGATQRMIRLPDRSLVTEGPAPTGGPGQPSLAPEIVAAFEADAALVEPLFFDGGHPDAPGFALFTDAVVDWIQAEGLLPTASPAPGVPPP